MATVPNDPGSLAPKSGRARGAGIAAALGAAASNQLGAACGSLAFPVIGPVGVVAVRQTVAAVVLLALARPRFWRFTRAQWWPVLLLSLTLATMNLTLYFAIQRIGLGLAVTLEFLGPLGLAVANTRSRIGALSAAAACAGVLAITHPDASSDYPGIALALVAAGCWAAYILLNKTIGRRLPGLQGTATASGVSAMVFLPLGAFILISSRPDYSTILFAILAGLFASAVPFALDLIALRRLPTAAFGILSSVQPVFAATFGAVLLKQMLLPIEWLGILLIAGANTLALGAGKRTGRRPAR